MPVRLRKIWFYPGAPRSTLPSRKHLVSLLAVLSLAVFFVIIISEVFCICFSACQSRAQTYRQQEYILGNEKQALPFIELPLQFGNLSSKEHSKYDYNLADIVNIAAFRAHDPRPLDNNRIQEEAKLRPESIIGYYAEEKTQCTVFPSLTRLKWAVRKHFWKRYISLSILQDRSRTLVIHHEPTKLDRSFLQVAVNLAKHFRIVRLLVPDNRLTESFEKVDVIVHLHNTTDDILAFMATARHLLVHTGETSALGALLGEGTVYHSHGLSEYTTQNSFKWLIHNRVSLTEEMVSVDAI